MSRTRQGPGKLEEWYPQNPSALQTLAASSANETANHPYAYSGQNIATGALTSFAPRSNITTSFDGSNGVIVPQWNGTPTFNAQNAVFPPSSPTGAFTNIASGRNPATSFDGSNGVNVSQWIETTTLNAQSAVFTPDSTPTSPSSAIEENIQTLRFDIPQEVISRIPSYHISISGMNPEKDPGNNKGNNPEVTGRFLGVSLRLDISPEMHQFVVEPLNIQAYKSDPIQGYELLQDAHAFLGYWLWYIEYRPEGTLESIEMKKVVKGWLYRENYTVNSYLESDAGKHRQFDLALHNRVLRYFREAAEDWKRQTPEMRNTLHMRSYIGQGWLSRLRRQQI